MSVTLRLAELREERAARRAARREQDALIRELADYRTAAERMELELIISRTAGTEADHLLDVLNQTPVAAPRIGLRRSA